MTYGLIFDMDGVLVDTGPFHESAWEQLASENDLTTDHEFFVSHFGMTNPMILPEFFGRALSEEEIARFGDRKEELFREIIHGQVRPLEGVLELATGLKDFGFRLGVGSSGPRENVEMIVNEIGIAPLLEACLASDQITRSKPDPQVFLKAAAQMQVGSANCVVVEDAIVGVQAARAAGMKCIAVTNTFPAERLGEADQILDSLAQTSPEGVLRLLTS